MWEKNFLSLHAGWKLIHLVSDITAAVLLIKSTKICICPQGGSTLQDTAYFNSIYRQYAADMCQESAAHLQTQCTKHQYHKMMISRFGD